MRSAHAQAPLARALRGCSRDPPGTAVVGQATEQGFALVWRRRSRDIQGDSATGVAIECSVGGLKDKGRAGRGRPGPVRCLVRLWGSRRRCGAEMRIKEP